MSCLRALCLLAVLGLTFSTPGAERVMILVDDSVLPEISDELTRYTELVSAELPVTFSIAADSWYDRTPAEIRAALAAAYRETNSLAGAIMVGPIPCALHERGPKLIVPTPLYYEDFDAEWIDADNDGDFEQFDTDRTTNATEIWTAWWIPPSTEPVTQAAMLESFLIKLNRRYADPPAARNTLLFGAGRVNSLRIGQAWAALLEQYALPAGQRIRIYMQALPGCLSVHSRDGVEFTTPELLHTWQARRWQHVHIVARGEPDRVYWPAGELTGSPAELTDFDNTGAELITCSASSAANFRGVPFGPAQYDRNVANRYLFAPNTLTVAFVGSVTPQAGGTFAHYHTELMMSLDPTRASYLAQGYQRMRNSSHIWGTEQFIFRGMDEKALLGDPFMRYHKLTDPFHDTAAD